MEKQKRSYPKNVKRVRTVFSARPGQILRMEGQRFGYLTVLRRAGRQRRYITWLCRCDCGTEIEVNGHYLRRGKTKACGKNGHHFKPENRTNYIAEYPSEYQSWLSMRGRCYDAKHKNYTNYGGRGITVCERWVSDFKAFLMDMGRKPDPKFTIERDDVNGNYQPGNCRWIARKDQGRNKRNSVFVTYGGKKMLLIDLVEELGLSRNVVHCRLNAGWTLAQAIALPVKFTKPKGPYRKKPVLKKVLHIATFDDSAMRASSRLPRKTKDK
jgi:hypothetical protein